MDKYPSWDSWRALAGPTSTRSDRRADPTPTQPGPRLRKCHSTTRGGPIQRRPGAAEPRPQCRRGPWRCRQPSRPELAARCWLLQELWLYINSIGDEGARALAGALPSLPGLQELRLYNNR
ncbi:unnamed protein product, partial [Prorocentrum cordatum]